MKDVTAAIIVKEGKIFIAKRKSTDKLPNKWEFPGGKIESNETPQECLKREMKEEFGVDISVGECLGESVYHYDHGSIRLLAYQAYWQGGSFCLTDHADFEWVSLNQLQQFDFAPADVPFVEGIKTGKIKL
jgi:8-oxo-dGTP diphosphatase